VTPPDTRVVVLIWPWPGRDEAPLTVTDALCLARALPAGDDPFPTLDSAARENAVVLAGDHATGPVLAMHDAEAGVRDYEEVIAAAVNQGMFVYAAGSGPGGVGVHRYETPDINSRPQRRRVAANALVVSAAGLTAHDWPTLDAMPDHELARRARLLLATPDGIPPLILTYADAATGATA
jgi:hypothetical protein